MCSLDSGRPQSEVKTNFITVFASAPSATFICYANEPTQTRESTIMMNA